MPVSARHNSKKGKRVGSSGSGRLSDYPGSSRGTGGGGSGGNGGGGGSGGGGGGASGGGGSGGYNDRCGQAFHVDLEDVEHSDYFKAHGTVPPVGTELRIAHRKRIVAETLQGESVGNIPTTHNYLADCLKDGRTYTGTVRVSAGGPPAASVSADFAPV